MLVERGNLNRLDFINEETLVILYQFPPPPLDGIGWCTDEVITPWPHMPNLIQLVQGTEQVLMVGKLELSIQWMRTHLTIGGSCAS
jgi:hypothetical protein